MLRTPPDEAEIQTFSDRAAGLATYRKFAPTARNYTAARLMADVGFRVNDVRYLVLADIAIP